MWYVCDVLYAVLYVRVSCFVVRGCGVSRRYIVFKYNIFKLLKVRDLGVTFDQFLNFDDHIIAICRSTYFHIRNIGKIRNLLSYNACSTIIHALISCRLDYCNSLLYNVPTLKIDRLQRLQNQCARILTKSQRREHITPVLKAYIGSKFRIESHIKY